VNPAAWRADFPALHQEVHGRPLVYLDSASTTLKPQAVIDEVVTVFARDCANVHRGVHALSEAATAAFDAARQEVATLIGAQVNEIVFTRGTTESINLVAQAWGRTALAPGDAVVATALEHHSNLVPWQLACAERGARLLIAPVDDGGRIDLAALAALLDGKVRLVAVSHVSNVVGTVAPVAEIARLAHAAGALLLVDGAQAVAHLPVDVGALGCDFYAFSGHKLFGPTGVGVLWGRAELLAAMPPWQGGGEMVASVDLAGARFREPPYRFEAGTPDIAGVVGLGAAVRYLRRLDRDAIAGHERALHARLVAALAGLGGVRVLGRPELAVAAFDVAGIPAHDLATIVDRDGIAIRSGHHCAEPLHRRFGLAASARASLAFYNTAEEIDLLAASIARARPRGAPAGDGVRQLYQALIVDHARAPRHAGPLPDATHQATADNPLCGDQVTMRLRLVDGTIAAVAFEGQGCSLSQAAASLLSIRLTGAPLAEARTLAARFTAFVGDPPSTPIPPDLGDLAAFVGVRAFRSRQPCATLAAEAFLRAVS
jgi:cysteine desulfurase / selenocysteine lyase